MDIVQELRLNASDDTLYTVLDALEHCLDKASCPDDVKTQLLIAAEEIFVNIAHYAYGGEAGEAIVQICISSEKDTCEVTFQDRGIPYNPLEKKDPDTTLSAMDRSIGGLGIYMVKQTMDCVEYQYKEGYNILKLTKSMKG